MQKTTTKIKTHKLTIRKTKNNIAMTFKKNMRKKYKKRKPKKR